MTEGGYPEWAQYLDDLYDELEERERRVVPRWRRWVRRVRHNAGAARRCSRPPGCGRLWWLR